MKPHIALCGLLLSGVCLAATDCEKPVAPSIPEQGLSTRLERQLNRDMRNYLKDMGQFANCLRSEFRAASADNAPESELQGLVVASNVVVRELEELAAVYEERIGPFTELVSALPRQRNGWGNRDPWAGQPWSGTDPNRFPSYVSPPPGMVAQ